MVVDSQASALPTRPLKRRYSSKNQRLKQKSAKQKDKTHRNQYTQMISRIFENSLNIFETKLKVWHVRSNDDRCLQAADVISHLFYEGETIRDYVDEKKFLEKLSLDKKNLIYLQTDERWKKIKKDRDMWFITYEIIKPNIGFIRRPRYLLRKKIGRFKRRHSYSRTNYSGGNR